MNQSKFRRADVHWIQTVEMNKSQLKRMALALGTIDALLCGNAAIASQSMPIPETRVELSNHEACVARLNEIADQHRKQAKPRTFEPDGSFQQIFHDDISGGVEATGPETARYEAQIWYHNGWLIGDGTKYEISHSWYETNHECQGNILIMNDSKGWTTSTFEPASPKGPWQR